MAIISYKKVDFKLINQLHKIYAPQECYINDPSKAHVYQTPDCTITVYVNHTVLLQGSGAKAFDQQWFSQLDSKISTYYTTNIIGSDEVGVGDIFGPLVVTAVYFPPHQDYTKLKALNVKDSKLLNDSQIKTLSQQLIKLVQYKTIIVTNQQYNKMYNQYQNAHVIKTKAHCLAIQTLHQAVQQHNPNPIKVIIDQYASANKFYSYAQTLDIPLNNIKSWEFTTKAESKYLVVAVASIISRAYFLKSLVQLTTKYQLVMPLGASNPVKQYAHRLKKLRKDYKYYLKIHFNTESK